MGISRRSFIARSAVLAALSTAEFSQEQKAGAAAASNSGLVTLPPVKLHGYGTLSATVQTLDKGRSSVTHITCESAEKALLTQAKYLSDAQRLPGVELTHVSLHGRFVPARRTPSGGAVVCMAHGLNVMILAANDEKTLPKICNAYLPASAAPEDFKSRARIPLYLDRWDRNGLLFYIGPETRPEGIGEQDQKYDYADCLKFAQEHAPTGYVYWANPIADDHSEGLTNEQSWGWLQKETRKRGIPTHINLQIQLPVLWLANRFREQTMLKAPQFLGGYYGVSHDTAATSALSWLSQEGWDAQFGIFQSIVKKFGKDPNIVGWLEPHGETAETPQKFFLESGAYADEQWRIYLRRKYKTLGALSKRWYGDAAHLKTWSQVIVPEVADFAGFGPGAIDLRGTWRVKYVPAPDGHLYNRDQARILSSPPSTAPVPAEWYQPGFDDGDWDEFTAPGNDRMLFIPRSPLVYRRTIDVTADWLADNPQVTLTIWDMVNREKDVTGVYVNGKQIKEQSHLVYDQHWGQFDLTGTLEPGKNTIVLQMPRAIICYRAYISKEKTVMYPHLGPYKNAQWVDFVDWNTDSRGAQIRRGAEMIRQVDPDSSINFMAANDYYEPIKKSCQDYGGRFHDTGGMAGYWTEWNTLMMSGAGLPVTAEAGNGAPNIRELQMFFGRWLTEGVNGIHYFQNWGEIAWNPEVLKCFNENLPMYSLIGKYHSPFAKVATLYSMQNDYLTGFPWRDDRGESRGGENSIYNSAGHLINYCPRDGVGASDFGTPLVDKFRMIIDSNSSYMSEELIGNIETYVRKGGIFVTFGESGRHTPTVPDSWPISRLTGYSVFKIFDWGAGKTFSAAPDQKILGPTDIPQGTRSLGPSFKPVAPECRALANWDDGSVAIGLRPLGKGYVICLAPAIRDERFVSVIGAIMRHFGINDRVPATAKAQPGLHFRNFIGNTGLHDIWTVFNESDEPHTTEITFLPGVHPESLKDVVTGQKVEITRDPSGDVVSNIDLAKWQTKIFISPRADVTASPGEWLKLQRGWWQGIVKPPQKHLPTPAEQQRYSVDLTGGWAYKNTIALTDEQAAELAQPGVDDSKWERRQLDLWLTPGDMSLKRHLLRRKFTVPAHWTDGQIELCADLPGLQFCYETRTFLDGKALFNGRKQVDGPYFDTPPGTLKPGSTYVLALDNQGKSSLTGSRGPFWLYYLPNPKERQDLAGTWDTYSNEFHKNGETQLPGKVKDMIFTRKVVIDKVHKNQNVVIHLEAANSRFAIMVNGRRINSSELWRGHSFQFNVTPIVKFGEENLIEIVCSNGDKEISKIEIRYYAKGVFP